MEKLKNILIVLKDWRLTLSGLLGIGLMFYSYTAPIGFILILNTFDLLGYRNVLKAELHNTDIELSSYRVMQAMFHVMILTLIYFVYGGEVALCGGLLHWFGLQDFIYYIIGGYDFPKIWSWLRWTPLGLIKGDLSNTEMIIQLIIGLIIGYSSLIILVGNLL